MAVNRFVSHDAVEENRRLILLEDVNRVIDTQIVRKTIVSSVKTGFISCFPVIRVAGGGIYKVSREVIGSTKSPGE